MPDIFVAKKEGKPKAETSSYLKKTLHKIKLPRDKAKSPKEIFFANKKEDEEIILFSRGHIATNLPWATISSFFIILPLLLFFTINYAENPFPFMSGASVAIFTLLYYLTIFAYAFINFMKWFYNILIITTLGVVDIDYSDLVYHDVAITNLNLVEDVNYTKTGFFRSFLNYGDLFVQTAGGKENLEALGISNPAHAAHIIANSIGKGDKSG